MNENLNQSRGSQYAQRIPTCPIPAENGTAEPGPQSAWAPRNGETSGGLEPWPFIELLLRRWHWMVLSALLFGAAGFFTGVKIFKAKYVATVKLLRVDVQNATEFYKPRNFSDQTYGSLLRTPELLQRVASKAQPRLSPQALSAGLSVTPVRDSEVVMALLPGATPQAALDLANLFAQEAAQFTRELQTREASAVNEALKQQLAAMDADVQSVNEQLRAAPRASLLQQTGRGNELTDQLLIARQELNTLLSRYTDLHPIVQEQKAKISVLEKQLADTPPNAAGPSQPAPYWVAPRIPGQNTLLATNHAPTGRPNGPGHPGIAPPAIIKAPGAQLIDLQTDYLLSQLQVLSAARLNLATRQREAQLFAERAPGYCQVLAPATAADITPHSPKPMIAFLSVLGLALGFGGALALAMLVELMDDRVKTVDDLKRITHLPVIATLGNLKRMSCSNQSHWAFRTWTALQSRLSLSPNQGFICGLISSGNGEGRSAWIHLLAQAASECGFRVLTITAQEPITAEAREEQAQELTLARETSAVPSLASKAAASDSLVGPSQALTTSVLAVPAMVTQKLTSQDPHPYVHIPLPGWVWSLERRKQWQSALGQWGQIDNIVILVELPPASTTEAVLLAENLPNLLWLSDARKAHAAHCRDQLQTLREARCHLVGAVLNRQTSQPLRRRFSRWVSPAAFLAGLGILLGAPSVSQAQRAVPAYPPSTAMPYEASLAKPSPAMTNTAASSPVGAGNSDVIPAATAQPAPAVPLLAAQTNYSFSVVGPNQRAPWQQHFTLGPGDLLNIALFGQPELARTEVMIGPDGRLSYLQADVPAGGLTVDELRAKLDQELGKYYRAPRTMVTPVLFRSKKYYMLGKVFNRGVYVLDQPITILEAVARARGIETGLVDNQNSIDLADLQHSFLARRGKRVPIDFEKLFQAGDLSQNVPMEPDDYVFIASGNLKEVYVFGEVNAPGPVTYTAATTVIGAISARAGFTEKAYKGRVLVIRGSLNKPQTFVIASWGTLEGKNFDFKLQPKDIIYVAHRPFVRVEEVLDLAATAFIQSAISAWATDKVPTIFTSPILP